MQKQLELYFALKGPKHCPMLKKRLVPMFPLISPTFLSYYIPKAPSSEGEK
jgi:hypothetical protein